MRLARRTALRSANSCTTVVFSCLFDIILSNRELGLYLVIYSINFSYKTNGGSQAGMTESPFSTDSDSDSDSS